MSLLVDEFKCPCCGKVVLDTIFFAMARLAREAAGVPFIINSGYRCPKHNKEEGSTSQNHVMGKAMDIKAVYGPERGRILYGLYKAGFKRIGIASTYIHADSMDKIESCWLYPIK